MRAELSGEGGMNSKLKLPLLLTCCLTVFCEAQVVNQAEGGECSDNKKLLRIVSAKTDSQGLAQFKENLKEGETIFWH